MAQPSILAFRASTHDSIKEREMWGECLNCTMKFALNGIPDLMKFALINYINFALGILANVICTKGHCEVCTKIPRPLHLH